MAFLDAKLDHGGDLLVGMMNLEKQIQDADLLITDEGGINHQIFF